MVIAAEAASAVPDGMVAIEMATDEHAQAGTAAAARLLGELEREVLGGDHVVTADDALMLHAEDLLEVHAAQSHEGGGVFGGRPAQFSIERRDELLAYVAVRGGDRRDAGHAEFIDQPPLQGPIGAFTAAARLRRVAQDVFDAQLGESPSHLGQAPGIEEAPATGVCTAQWARSVYNAIGRPGR